MCGSVRHSPNKNYDWASTGSFGLGYNLAAGWSSPVAREAHNLEVAGSNPVPATCFSSSETGRPQGYN